MWWLNDNCDGDDGDFDDNDEENKQRVAELGAVKILALLKRGGFCLPPLNVAEKGGNPPLSRKAACQKTEFLLPKTAFFALKTLFLSKISTDFS